MNKYTVFYDQRNRTNFQVFADDVDSAIEKADELYKKNVGISHSGIQNGWIVESDGEDK